MTTYSQNAVTCGCCGRVFEIAILQSTNAFGSPDLDLRPPGMQRSTIHSWVRRCPQCGYCAREITKSDPVIPRIVESEDYRQILEGGADGDLSSSFLACAWIEQALGQVRAAAFSYLHAAWAAEDSKQASRMVESRRLAADLMIRELNEGRPPHRQPGASEVVIADCLRRAGKGDEALPLIDAALLRKLDPQVGDLLRYERQLIADGDHGIHTLKEGLAKHGH